MNGLEMLIFLSIGAIGGWCLHALLSMADKPYPRPWIPSERELLDRDADLFRKLREWDNR